MMIPCLLIRDLLFKCYLLLLFGIITIVKKQHSLKKSIRAVKLCSNFVLLFDFFNNIS
jgi:hypothetical protein